MAPRAQTQNPLTQTAHPAALPDVAEDALVVRAAAGDESAFEAIMRRYNQHLYRAARSIIRNEEQAQEVLQNAYLKVWNALGQFRGDAKLSTWMTRIVINEALGELRRPKGNEISLDEAMESPSASVQAALTDTAPAGDPERAAMRDELRLRLENSIDSLPEIFRTVFMLRGVQGMAAEEVAHALGISNATVRTRYFRARRLLQSFLEATDPAAHEHTFKIAHAHHDRVVTRVLGCAKQVLARD